MIVADAGKGLVLNAWGDALDNGLIQLRTAGGGLVSTTVLNADAFPAAAGAGTVSITANQAPALTDPAAAGDAANDVTQCHVRQQDETLVTTLTAGIATDDPVPEVVLSNKRITPGDIIAWALVKFQMV